MNTWVNDILVLANNRYLVVDHQRNIFVFKRDLVPTNEMQKFQLQVVAQINSGEEISRVILGSVNAQECQPDLTHSRDHRQLSCIEEQDDDDASKPATRTLMRHQVASGEHSQNDDLKDVPAEGQATDPRAKPGLREGQDYVRQLCSLALQHVLDSKSERESISILYGTLEGSLGQLSQIPKTTYIFLKRLITTMEQYVRGVSSISLNEYRQVRLDTTFSDQPKNIIDGAYLEQFLDLEEHTQSQIVKGMLLNQHDMSQAYLLEVKELVRALAQKH